MRLTGIRLRNFRNYQALDLAPGPGLNLLLGENAAGKTNVLEALFLSALGKSHRAGKDPELIRTGEDYAAIDLALDTSGGSRTIGVRLSRREKKKVLLDGSRLNRSGDLMGCLTLVLFAPEDLTLIKDGPGERRRFLNMAISQQTPRYYFLLQAYNLALKQRNALLKREELPGDEEFLPWEEQLAAAGAQIMAHRERFAGALSGSARRSHELVSGGKEILSLSYQPALPWEAGMDASDYGELLLTRLKESRRRDVFRGGTGVGPHRDDLTICINGEEAKGFASQGQQRTAVLSLKLAELEILSNIRGEKPVLLLDDVFSELDRKRQALLLSACREVQTFITCTHLDTLPPAGEAELRRYHIQGGALVKEE